MSTEEAVQQELFDIAKSPEPPAESAPSAAEPQSPSSAPAESRVAEPTRPDSASESIPSWRLREEAEARRVAEERARTLQARMEQIEAHWRQQQGSQQTPSWFEDPQAAMRAALEEYNRPILKARHDFEMKMSREMAEYRYGPEAVNLAEKFFMDARAKGILDPLDHERVVSAPNRFSAVVEWYKRLYSLHTVGDDPEAWYRKRRDAELADPKFQAEYLGRIRGDAATRPGMTELPPTLSRSTTAAGNGAGLAGDMSHESLWAHTRK
jgi:hypothetical protein